MPTTIQDLYYGNITPADQTMPADSPLRKLTAQLAKYEAGLTGLLDAEDVPLLKALVDTQQQIDSITAEENFIYGFKLGVQLMVECLGGEPDG